MITMSTRPLRILVVDDDPAMVGAITALVGTEGHQVITAYDGLTAVKRFREESPDLVLLDLAMPGPDGFNVAGQMRAVGPAPILIVSGESGCTGLAGVLAAIAALSPLGLNWACVWVGVVFVLRALTAMWIVGKQDGVPMSGFLVPMIKPLAASIAMAIGVSAARLAFAGLPAPVLLPVEIALGAAIYSVGLLLFARSRCNELLRITRSALATAP